MAFSFLPSSPMSSVALVSVVFFRLVAMTDLDGLLSTREEGGRDRVDGRT